MEKRYDSMMVSPEKMCKDYRADHPVSAEELTAQIPQYQALLTAAQGFADAMVPFLQYVKEVANGQST